MSTGARLAGFGLGLAAVLGAGYGMGLAVDLPGDETPTVGSTVSGQPTGAAHGEHGEPAETAAGTAEAVGGLAVAERGYTLRLVSVQRPAGASVPVRFTITGRTGEVLTEYQVEHEKELHFIAVRRDFTGYQHVHPTRDATGWWLTRLDLTPGSWRVFADFVPGDGGAPEGVTLGADIDVAGDYRPASVDTTSTVATVDGYRVTLDGSPRAAVSGRLAFTVTRDGTRVGPEPYLGARGHLVALREGDLAYLHVHPDEDALSFAANFPNPGRYRLFLDFQVDAVVRTATFTVEVR